VPIFNQKRNVQLKKFMKNNLFKSILFLSLSTLILFAGCKKKIEDAYLNPNALTIQPIESILPGVIGGFTWFASNAGTAYGVVSDGTLVGRYIQYFGIQTTGDSWGRMSHLGGAVDNGGSIWATFYYGHGQNVNRIIQWGTEQEKWDYVGVGWAIRAWGLLELTNEYGEAPLKQAFNSDLSQFLYDTQPEFYDESRLACHKALSFLNRTDGKVSKENLAIGDAFFNGGDVNKWKKFTYGILARSFINLSSKNIFKTNNYADSAIIYANLAMTTNADNATVKVAGGPNSNLNNWWGPFRANIGTYRQGAYIANLMSGANTVAFTNVPDPRRWYMLSENANGTFKGFLPWSGAANTPGNDYPKNFWRHPTPTATVAPAIDSSRYLYQNTSPWPMMTASEMQFIVAEAAFKKDDKATALAAYRNAISLNFDMLTNDYPQNIPAGRQITPAVKAAYLANPAVVPETPASLTLSQIMLQKYTSLYIWGTLQTWTDMRKYHYNEDLDPITGKPVYADFTPPTGLNLISTNNGKLTYRMRPRYNSEYLYNVPELTRIGALNADYNTYEMWFSMK
jgi:hypothetical protein